MAVTRILILTAVELEARRLARALELPALPRLSFPAWGRGRVRLAPVGLRARRLDVRWASLSNGFCPALVVSAGVCGGLDPALARGDLVLPVSVVGPSGETLKVTPSHHRLAVERAGGSVHTGLLVTTRDVVATPEAKAALRARTGGVAVDMESALILGAAAAAGCPSLVVRGVSDGATEALPPEVVGLLTAEGRLKSGHAALLAVRRPRVIPRALGLRRGAGQALSAVARSLAGLVR